MITSEWGIWGVWLQVGAKFGLVALVGLLRFHGNRGGKHVLSTFAQKMITIILVNDQYLSDLKSTFQIDKYCNNLILFFELHQDNYRIFVKKRIKSSSWKG